MTPLQKFLDQASGDVLLLHDSAGAAVAAGVTGASLVVAGLGGPVPEPPGKWAAVVVVVADLDALRSAVDAAGAVGDLGRSRGVACVLTAADRPLTLAPRPEWPELQNLQARRLPSGAALTTARWTRPVNALPVLQQLARAAAPVRTAGHGGVVVAHSAGGPDSEVPPDVVVDGGSQAPTYAVTGRAPLMVSARELPLTVDETVWTPHGFRQYVDGPVVTLRADEISPASLSGLREHRGVWLEGRGDATDSAVARLAMAGVPVSCGQEPGTGLGPRLREALTTPVDLADDLAREEHSIRLRRAAYAEHSTPARRALLAERAGLRAPYRPSISVLLATKREALLDFALRQVARQRDVDMELVLAAHGFSPDPARVRDLLGDRAVTVIGCPAETIFGDVLAAALDAAAGDLVVKMDDDDWYAPDFLADLLRARHQSGADLVGNVAEFFYLEASDRTVRRREASEVYTRYVAGGTMLMERLALRELGGFRPVHRFVDAQLRRAVQAAGGTTYRTHGLGYVLRRSAQGHTWQVDPADLATDDRAAASWPGFRPSDLMEAAAEDLPRPSA